jgi:hydrogenase assembly chaperone HypC/HupF
MCLAYPAQVVSTGPDVAEVEAGGRRQRVITICLDGGPPTPGEWVLVNCGLAVSRLNEEELRELSG